MLPEEALFPGEQLMERLTNRDFKIDLWEDHSDLLKQFAVQLVFSYGSMNQFWSERAPHQLILTPSSGPYPRPDLVTTCSSPKSSPVRKECQRMTRHDG